MQRPSRPPTFATNDVMVTFSSLTIFVANESFFHVFGDHLMWFNDIIVIEQKIRLNSNALIVRIKSKFTDKTDLLYDTFKKKELHKR